MYLFQCKITQDQYLSLSPFISLQETFEEFYQFIQKLPDKKQDIKYKESQSLLRSKIFKTNLVNNQNLQEIILANLDLITALRLYQWLFNTNYMNLHVIHIKNDKTKCFLNAKNLKNMINNDLWPDILCFILPRFYEGCIVNYIESVLQKSDNESWELKSIIASNGILYMSIVKKQGFWYLSRYFCNEIKKLTLSEAIIEALENGFKPMSFFYFYEAKKIAIKEYFLLKGSEIYVDYYKKLDKIQEFKSKCCGEEKIASSVMKVLRSDEGCKIRNIVKIKFLDSYCTENAPLSRENRPNYHPRYTSVEGMMRSSPQTNTKRPKNLELNTENSLKNSKNAEIIDTSSIETQKTHENNMISSNFTGDMIKNIISGPKTPFDIKSPIWKQEDMRSSRRIPVQPMNIITKKSTQMVEETKNPIEKDDKSMLSSARRLSFPEPLDLGFESSKTNANSKISGNKTEECKKVFNMELPFGISRSEEQRKTPPLMGMLKESAQEKLAIPKRMSPPPLPKINIPPRRE